MYYLTAIAGFILGNLTKEKINNIFKNDYDLSKSEREFYDEMIKKIYKFIGEIKKYEFENNTIATREQILANPTTKKQYQEFVDSANEFVGKSFVFLSEDSYRNLQNSLKEIDSFADLANGLLFAMRKSLYPNTTLHTRTDLKEFHYK